MNRMPHERAVYIETVGCQMNVLDSELVIAALKKQGYTLTDDPHAAGVILFNTCSVREHAEEKTYSALGRVAPIKRDHPETVIGVIGCMAQKDQDHIRTRAPYVDMIVGTGQLSKIPSLVDEVRRTNLPQLAVSLGRTDGGRTEIEASFESYDPARDPEMRPTPFQAFVRIQIGCDKFCTYCVVPSTRGPEQSRHPDHILAEVRTLADQGCLEVTLLGQTVNSYVYDHGDGRRTRISDLIARIHDVPSIRRIKFVTNFPKDMSNDLLDAVRDLPKAVKYLHVPVQSGCDTILKRMKRLYTVAEYREVLARIRERIPGVAVSSDFIVGFCGETEESFQKSMVLVDESKFKNSFIFKYSERPGTSAAGRFPDDVPDDVKRRRNHDLLEVQDAYSLIDHRQWIGKSVEVLVEGPSRKGHKQTPNGPGGRQLIGRTMTDHIAVFQGQDRLIGQIVTVDVIDAHGFTLYGEVRINQLAGLPTGSAITPELPIRPRRIGLDLL